MGFRPIILDRGKVVRERSKDTWGLWRRGVLDPEANVQFGEGRGHLLRCKLYSRIRNPRHLDRKVLIEFVKAGAPPEILMEAHPHIGKFRLVTMVESMRATIEQLGGEAEREDRAATDDTICLLRSGAGQGAQQNRQVMAMLGGNVGQERKPRHAVTCYDQPEQCRIERLQHEELGQPVRHLQ